MPDAARVLANRYELGAEIGRGGMARVYLARDLLLERAVAVKVLSELDSHDDTAFERFRREAQAAASLNHPNIVGVYDWGEEGDTAFIVMEYVEGHTLRDLIHEYGRLPAQEAARVAAEIAAALAFAHRNGVVHRDVKPGNVLITLDGAVKVTDFGIARSERNDALTKTGSVVGTATYFSPEQAQGHVLDGRSDVYALGVVLYEMLTGAAPFTADSPVSVAYKHVREAPQPPSALAPDTSGAMDRIVLTAMAKDLGLRYQSADELRADLLRFERGRPLRGGPVTAVATEAPTSAVVVPAPRAAAIPAARTSQPMRRRERRWGAIITTGIAMIVLLAFIAVLLVNSDFGGDSPTVATTAVPDVVGIAFADAQARLVQDGFVVAREDTESVGQPVDLVLAQSPERGRKVEKGATVTLTVSSATISLPDLVGRTRAEADQILKSKGLVPTYVEQDSDQPPGTVLSTTPPAGTAIAKADPRVEVAVADEPPVAVPDVTGQPQTTATAVLASAGFQVVTESVPSDTVPVGNVVGTNPALGALLEKGSAVTLLVSSGPGLIPIPNVVGQPQATAVATLTGAGFGVVIQYTNAGAPRRGIVISQTPAGGQAPRLTNVTITVGF